MQKAADLAVTSTASEVAELDASALRLAAAELYASNILGDTDSSYPSELGPVADSSGEQTGCAYQIGNDRVTVWNPYSDDMVTARRISPASVVCIEAEREVALPFLAVAGIRTAVVKVRAVAAGFPSGPCFIFANSTDPNAVGIDWSSQGGTIYGDIHSNTRVSISGNNHTSTGWIDYRYGYSVGGSGHVFVKGFRLGNVMGYPIHYTPADFAPYTYIYNGNLNFPGHEIPAGVYYVKGKLQIMGDDVALGPVTFVVEGKIHVTGGGHNFTAARNNVLFYSLAVSDKASDKAIDINAQGGEWTGICFAPNGNVKYSASDQHIYNGGIVANTIELTGQDFTANAKLPPLPRFYSQLVR
jgi:hypothetical protein